MSSFDELLEAASKAKAGAQPAMAKAKAKQTKIEDQLELTLPLDQILLREADTRPVNHQHVEALAESIAAVGLIQPVAVDIQGRLLAGAHRRAAIAYLAEHNTEAFNKWFKEGVQVRQYDFDATGDTELALAIEATENEKRRDYTKDEVIALAKRLEVAGYRTGEGKPKKGEKRVIGALSVIIGKSERTVRRYLNPENNKRGQMDAFKKISIPLAKRLKKLMELPKLPDDIAEHAGALLDALEAHDQ